jgi:hypothetical protein
MHASHESTPDAAAPLVTKYAALSATQLQQPPLRSPIVLHPVPFQWTG